MNPNRYQAWAHELKTPGDRDRHMVERMVNNSWQLDRADTFEQARLAKRIHGTELESAAHEPARCRRPRQAEWAEPVSGDPLSILLRELASSAEGCRLLIADWTGLLELIADWTVPLEWLGRLGPKGLATSDAGRRRKWGGLVLALVGQSHDSRRSQGAGLLDDIDSARRISPKTILEQNVVFCVRYTHRKTIGPECA